MAEENGTINRKGLRAVVSNLTTAVGIAKGLGDSPRDEWEQDKATVRALLAKANRALDVAAPPTQATSK